MMMELTDKIAQSKINVSQYETIFKDGNIYEEGDRIEKKIASLVVGSSGFSICYGIKNVLSKHGLSLDNQEGIEVGKRFLERCFKNAMSYINIQAFNVIENEYTHIGKVDVDGINKNKNHSPDNYVTKPREFLTTKCIHFDASSPFVANIYGPNVNVTGGMPTISFVHDFCEDLNIDARHIVENIPDNYNVTIKEEFYSRILNEYTFALDIDMENDLVLVVLCNEVMGGVAHGGTTPFVKDTAQPALRPIRHFEFQFSNPNHYTEWADFYSVASASVGDVKDETWLYLNYYDKLNQPKLQVISVDSYNEPKKAKLEKTKNLYQNNKKAIEFGNFFWEETDKNNLSGIVVMPSEGNTLTDRNGHKFYNLSCCSYLDLDRHPFIVKGAIDALQKYGALDHCITRIRIMLPALLELEQELSDLFGAKVVTALSASAATASVLPLIASGHFTKAKKPLMVFDKNAHFSMNLLKPICGDETVVITIPHNDMGRLELLCKEHGEVTYVCDGTYSMGGHAPVSELQRLQKEYGLFIYYDDSHSISIKGQSGEGYVRSQYDALDDKTIIVGTLNKAYGCAGAALMFGHDDEDLDRILERFGGPMAWSQPMNIPAIGACLAAVKIHKSSELQERQQKLAINIKIFDELIETEQQGNSFPIKLVKVDDDKVMECGNALYKSGFYVSPVFFPIVKRGESGLRVMLRAGIPKVEIQRMCEIIKSYT